MIRRRVVEEVCIALAQGGPGVCYSACPSPPALAMLEILNFLRKHGQRTESELANETGVPIAKVRRRLAELARDGRRHHLQPDQLGARLADRRVDGPHVRLGASTGARSYDEGPALADGQPASA